MRYKYDAYEREEYDLDRVVYVQFLNGSHITCVLGSLLNSEGVIENFEYDEEKGIFKETETKLKRFSVKHNKYKGED